MKRNSKQLKQRMNDSRNNTKASVNAVLLKYFEKINRELNCAVPVQDGSKYPCWPDDWCDRSQTAKAMLQDELIFTENPNAKCLLNAIVMANHVTASYAAIYHKHMEYEGYRIAHPNKETMSVSRPKLPRQRRRRNPLTPRQVRRSRAAGPLSQEEENIVPVANAAPAIGVAAVPKRRRLRPVQRISMVEIAASNAPAANASEAPAAIPRLE